MEYLGGVVERITYLNEENGFSIIKVRSKGHPDLVTVVGNLAAVNVGAVIRVKGSWKTDSKYGKQFSAVDYRETIPATVAGIEKYLGSGLIKGIGPVNAGRIVRQFQEDTIRVIEEEPDRLSEVEGIGPKRVEMIKTAWQEQKEIKNVMLFLQSNGVSPAYAVKIFKTYGLHSISIVKANPFRLAEEIWGIGFKTADQIARQLGFAKHSYPRCRSGLIYILNEFANDGHCYATRAELAAEAVQVLEVERELIEAAIDRMLEEQAILAGGKDAVFLPPFYYSETGTAKRIKDILASPPGILLAEDGDDVLSQVQEEHGIRYDEIQIQAIKTAASSKFMVLTGGPGTGKTTTTLALINVYRKMGAKILLAAPTGRAAKRLAETTGLEAKTIHRLLEYKPPEGFKKNAESPLECDVLIVDEASMVDIILMYNLLKAVPDESVVILVGDVDQLPAVGAGNVLRDIIDSGVVPVVRLTRIFRQAQGSAIITNAHKINKGEFPSLRGGKNSDFFYIEKEDPQQVVETIKELCARRLPKYYHVDPVQDIQVLCPMQRGETGTHNLNVVLQETLNPSELAIKYGGTAYRLKDKVMQVKNNYEKNVFNGDIGVIERIDLEDKSLSILFDGHSVAYEATELDEVVLAYATTVHKSQGSEYKIVVAPFTMQHYMMLQRNLLYTCVTRAKQVLVLVGSKKAIAIAVANSKIARRNTMLSARLRGEQ